MRFPTLTITAVVVFGVLGVLAPALSPTAAQISPRETNDIQADEFRRGHKAYIRSEFELAALIWTRLAEQGHIKSMNNLGTMYAQGKAVGQNFTLALQWYRRAVDKGDARAMYNIGIAHEFGRGVEQDDASAVSWYRQAADRGVVESMNRMARILATSVDSRVRDGTQAIHWASFAVKTRTSSAALSVLAFAHAEAGDFREAEAAVERAIDYMKRESDGADMMMDEHAAIGLLREEGEAEDIFRLLERREYYVKSQLARERVAK